MVFLGLDDDEEIEEYEPYEEAAVAPQPPRRQQPEPAATVVNERSLAGSRAMSAASPKEPSGAVRLTTNPAPARPVNPVPSVRVHVVVPHRFADSQEIGERCKEHAPVVVNLQEADGPLTRRVIDFCSGVTYALSGSMEKVAEQVFLLTPADLEVSVEERRRLQEAGFSAS